MKFKDMPYERLDIQELGAKQDAYTAALKEAKTYEEARKIFLDVEEEVKHTMTMATLAQVRHTIDTRDEFYDKENEFWDESIPVLMDHSQKWNKVLLESPFRPEFEKEFGEVSFINYEISFKSFKPELIPYMQKENELTTRYGKLLASGRIPFRGQEYTISQFGVFKKDADDETRLEAWKAEGQWYKDNQAELDDIYDQLVHLRDEMGKLMGYENYVPLGYLNMQRNCYDKNDVEKFRKAVRDYLVPVADKVYRAQAERLGKEYPMSFADNALTFRGGNPAPAGDADYIVNEAKKFYDSLSPETSAFFNDMLENEMMDLLSTEGKEGGGYCTEIAEYKLPFIFANFNGTKDDVETLTHEGGHAFEAWLNIDRVPMDQIFPSLEACEVHSMSMEFFGWKNAEGFFGDDARKFYYAHLADSLTFIPYGTMVDHFQHIVYENPDLTPRQRHDEWKKLLQVYMPWMKLDGDIPFYSEGEGWQRQHHIYQSPFYYIDYCLAQTVALEFWAMIQEDPDNAWKHYMAYTSQGGSQVFTKLLENADLESPFVEETLKKVCYKAGEWLDNYDLTGIN